MIAIAPDPVRLAAIEGTGGMAAILANPDTRLALPLPEHTARVILGYGIKAYAWRVRGMPPVTFEVYVLDGDRNRVIWRRSLDPARQSRDRGEQESVVAIPPDTRQVILATTSSDTTLSNRAYWSEIEFR